MKCFTLFIVGEKIMKKLLLAAVICLVAIVPASAAKVGISGSLLTEAFTTMDYDLDNDARGDFGQLRQDAEMDFTFQLSDNVLGVIDLRANNMLVNSGFADVLNVNQAYVQAKEFLYAPLTMTIGKQKMHYALRGDGMSMWLGYDAANAGITGDFDPVPVGFKGTLNYQNLIIDLFIMKYVESAAHPMAAGDTDLYGFNVDYWLSEDVDNLVNFYFGFLNDDASADGNVIASDGVVDFIADAADDGMINDSVARRFTSDVWNNYVGIVGLGVDYFLLSNALELTGEVAVQFGALNSTEEGGYESADLFAWAVDLAARYDWASVNYKPWIELSFALRSGQSDDDDKITAWQPLMENNDKTLLVEGDDQLGMGIDATGNDLASGYYAIRLGGGASFTDKISGNILFAVFGDMTNEDVPVNSVGAATDDNMIGFEVDLGVDYAYSENLSMGLDLGIFAPGSGCESENVPAALAAAVKPADASTAFGVLFTTALSF